MRRLLIILCCLGMASCSTSPSEDPPRTIIIEELIDENSESNLVQYFAYLLTGIGVQVRNSLLEFLYSHPGSERMLFSKRKCTGIKYRR